MRDFIGVDLDQMISEIQRDLSKSPKVKSERVQNQAVVGYPREALGYHYVVGAEDLAEVNLKNAVETMRDYSQFYDSVENRNAVRGWFSSELAHRYMYPEVEAPANHPLLSKYKEGSAYSYTYGERLAPYLDTAITTLVTQPTSRRVFLPIYTPQDLVRSGELTRIPCSLGYSLILRENQGEKFLHLTYLQRSCDFEVFWITDLLLALEFQKYIQNGLSMAFPVRLGRLDHFIISFHQFFRDGEEVF